MFKFWILFFTVSGVTRLASSQQSFKPAHVPNATIAAKVASPADFACDSYKIPLTTCIWEKANARDPSNPLLIHINANFKNGQTTSVPGYTYLGEGLESGQCGIRINDVKEDDNAQWSCTLISNSGILRGVVNVGILKKPSAPQFSEIFGRLNEGEEKTVTCFSANGQPAPTFQWFIDDAPVDASHLTSVSSQTDQNGVVTTFQQLLKYKFTWEQNGKKLRCLTVSDALTPEDIAQRKNEASMNISVDFAPKAIKNEINVKVPELDSQAIIAMNISANPDPKIYWTIGTQRVNPRFKTPDQKFEARAPKLVDDKDTYLCELVINSVAQEDLGIAYKLTAENQLGTGQFEIRLTSDAEPSGGLSAGGIVGLVLGIPVILILIALVVVYARAKGLLCFKGDDGTSSEKERMGEDADSNKGGTEGKPSISSRFSGVIGNLWAKKKDKTAPVDEEANKEKEKDAQVASPEEKKPEDIVYAELDLARGGPDCGTQPTVVVRCSDEKTEYAEIVGVAQSTLEDEKEKKSPSNSTNPSPKK